MIAIWLLTIWLALLMAGGTQTGRVMRRLLVEAPARALNRVHRGQYLMLLGILLLGATLGWLTDGEAVRMMIMGAPELAGMLASVELGAFVDVLVVALVASSTVRLHMAVTLVRRLFIGQRPRARRARSRPQRKTPANDDEDDAAAWAA